MKKIRVAESNECLLIKEHADQIYFKYEKDFWKEGYYRISKKDCLTAIKNKELFVFEENKLIIGFVLIKKNNTNLRFSMLTVIDKKQKNGYGRKILKFIINKAKTEKLKKISIEILCPKKWIPSQKEFLINWYEKNGFKFVKDLSFCNLYPEHKKFMKCDLIFKKYEKILLQ
tara:strand:+ start:1720 stop:2235 length:516 start_codon:yes stop_codon:yes gene_type:complete